MLAPRAPRIQVARDVTRIEAGTSERADPVTSRQDAHLDLAAQRSIIKIRAKNIFRRRAQIF